MLCHKVQILLWGEKVTVEIFKERNNSPHQVNNLDHTHCQTLHWGQKH